MKNSYYQTACTAVIKPRSVVITTRYFWRNWRPILGNDLAVLIIEARQKCYRNNNTGEVRDWFYSTLDELAQTVGFSSKKISRLLKNENAESFIRFKPTYIYNPKLEKRVKGKCLFKVALDDPLTPDDEMQLVRQDIHMDVSFKEHPNNQDGVKVVPLKAQPTGHDVRIKYSTFEKIKESKVIIKNHTRSGKGEHIRDASSKIGSNNTMNVYSNEKDHQQLYHERRMKYRYPEKYDHLYNKITDGLGKNSVLTRTILSSCFISKVEHTSDKVHVAIDVPNRYYQQILHTRYRKSFLRRLEQTVGERVELDLNSSAAYISQKGNKQSC